ncbi:Imm61 family immunity protein [Mycobacterium basiliense]|uniref:Imm61 family immunity protein n=1 Tax=Mycobacterium basiliense TaxID=2094119 RepID=UPI002F946160
MQGFRECAAVKNNVDLTDELQVWIRLAGLDMIQGSQTDDGRVVIWNNGGEDRYYVITSSQRMSTEHPWFFRSGSRCPH